MLAAVESAGSAVVFLSHREGYSRRSFPRLRSYILPIIISDGLKNLWKAVSFMFYLSKRNTGPHTKCQQGKGSSPPFEKGTACMCRRKQWWKPLCWKPLTTGSLTNTIFHISPLRKYSFTPHAYAFQSKLSYIFLQNLK